MLKRVEIHNFRSCHNVVLDDLGAVTVLVGRNAVGKSNILRDSVGVECRNGGHCSAGRCVYVHESRRITNSHGIRGI